MEGLAGCQPGLDGLSGYPTHWYDDDGNIPCPALGCSMLFDRWNIHKLLFHWKEKNSVMSPQTNTEHRILYVMLMQVACPYCNFSTIFETKELFKHEERVHGSSNMSQLKGSVSLARQFGHPEFDQAHLAIFLRLIGSIWEDGPLCDSIFRRASAGRMEITPHPENLADILSPPDGRPGGPGAPVITPTPPQNFLMHLAPTDPYSRIDPSWESTWEDLRRRYALGEI